MVIAEHGHHLYVVFTRQIFNVKKTMEIVLLHL